jgi:sialic acid synthase SpsE
MNANQKIFQNLFVLELANNHWGSLERGLKIVSDHARVVRYNNVKAAIKLQFRDVESFIHKKYLNDDSRYIQKTSKTKLTEKEFGVLVKSIKELGAIPMATPFDEKSVDLCKKFNFEIIKIASSDVNDWPLIEKIASLRKPVIASSGGASEKDLDDLVLFFKNRDIPLALNHCVSLYPSEDSDLQLDQVDYLRERFPDITIGFSTHEYNDWEYSMLISYAKGARTWERHIDIEYDANDERTVSKYCSLPENTDKWFKAHKKAIEMCGGFKDKRRVISKQEAFYLDELVRGVYVKKNLKAGYVFNNNSLGNDFYLAIPLQKGQLSCREIINGEKLLTDIKKDEPLTIDHVDGPYNSNQTLKKLITNRGA